MFNIASCLFYVCFGFLDRLVGQNENRFKVVSDWKRGRECEEVKKKSWTKNVGVHADPPTNENVTPAIIPFRNPRWETTLEMSRWTASRNTMPSWADKHKFILYTPSNPCPLFRFQILKLKINLSLFLPFSSSISLFYSSFLVALIFIVLFCGFNLGNEIGLNV